MIRRVAISRCSVRGVRRWRVRWHESGRVHRKFFTSEDSANAFAAVKRNESVGVRQLLAMISQAEQEKLVMVHNEAKRRGMDVLSLLLANDMSPNCSAPAAVDVVADMVTVKLKAGRDKRYVTNGLKRVCLDFISGREQLPVSRFGVPDVEVFMDSVPLGSKATVRSRLSTFFKFARRRKYRLDNPCDDLETVKVLKLPPQILSVTQVQACLKFLNKPKLHPSMSKQWCVKPGCWHPGTAWFLLTTFAGLRPEEAMACDPKKHLHLNGSRPHIEITPEITKTGQWRIVYPPPVVVTKLRLAILKRGCVLPVSMRNKERVLRDLRGLFGWKKWPQDITRHSASSYWLAISNDQKHVAEMLGHSERMARSTYKKPVPREQAEKFYETLSQLK